MTAFGFPDDPIPGAALSTGQELEQISVFLDALETSAEHVLTEARSIRRRMLALNDASEDRIYDLRVALEHLLIQLGGPSGASLNHIIDEDGQPVSYPSTASYSTPHPQPARPYAASMSPDSPPPTTPPVVPGPPATQPVGVNIPRTPPASSPIIPNSGQPLPMPPPTGVRVA